MKIDEKDLKVLFDNELHDSTITKIKCAESDFEISVSCKGMGLDYYYKNLEELGFIIKCLDVEDLVFDFDGLIDVNNFTITEKNDKLVIKVNKGDISLVCHNYEIKDIWYKEHKERRNSDKLLDDFLKTNL